MIDNNILNSLFSYIRKTIPVAGIGRVPIDNISGFLPLLKLKNFLSLASGSYGNSPFLGTPITSNYGSTGVGSGPGTNIRGTPSTRNLNYNYENPDRNYKLASFKSNACTVLFDAEVPATASVSLKKIISLNLNKHCYLIPAIFLMRSVRYLLYDLHKKYDQDITKIKIIPIPGNRFYPNYLIISEKELDLDLFDKLKEDAETAHQKLVKTLEGTNNYLLSINLNRFYELDFLQSTFNYDPPDDNFIIIGGYIHSEFENIRKLGLKVKNVFGMPYFVKEIRHNSLVLENVLNFFKSLNDLLTNKVLTFDEFIIRNSIFKESNLSDNINLMLHSVDYNSRKNKILVFLDNDNMVLPAKNLILNDKLFMIDDEISPVVLIVSDKMKILHPRVSKIIHKKKLLFKLDEIRAYII